MPQIQHRHQVFGELPGLLQDIAFRVDDQALTLSTCAQRVDADHVALVGDRGGSAQDDFLVPGLGFR